MRASEVQDCASCKNVLFQSCLPPSFGRASEFATLLVSCARKPSPIMDLKATKSKRTACRQEYAALFVRGADSDASSKDAQPLPVGECASPAGPESEKPRTITSLYASIVDPVDAATGSSLLTEHSVVAVAATEEVKTPATESCKALSRLLSCGEERLGRRC